MNIATKNDKPEHSGTGKKDIENMKIVIYPNYFELSTVAISWQFRWTSNFRVIGIEEPESGILDNHSREWLQRLILDFKIILNYWRKFVYFS